MAQGHIGGFEDGFVEIVEEQLDRCLKDVGKLDEEIGRMETEIASLRTQRGEAAKRVQQLEDLLRGAEAGSQVDAVEKARPISGKPFADADAVVELIREQGHAMHYRDIHQTLVDRGYEIGGEGKADTLLSRFFNDLRLTRVSPGAYDLVGSQNGEPEEGAAPKASSSRPEIFPMRTRLSIPPMPVKGLKSRMTLAEKAEEVLRQAKEPMHYGEITRRILGAGAWQPVTQTPEASVNSAMVIDIRDNGDKSVFVRTGRGIYGLREWTEEAT